MTTNSLFFQECHVAGRQYQEADEVWDELHVGTPLVLVRDSDNRYDPDAVAIVYRRPISDVAKSDLPEWARDDKDYEQYVLGYVPRCDNQPLASFFDMGWGDAFQCRLSRIDPGAHYERQLRVTIRIMRRN